MRVIGIVQARMGSTRLPGKVLLPVLEKPLLAYQLERIKRAKTLHDIVVAIPRTKDNIILKKWCENQGYHVYVGDEQNVLTRYYRTAKRYHAGIIVRMTADCPLIDPSIIDQIVNKLMENKNVQYVSNTLQRTFPRGLDVEAFTFDTLKKAYVLARRLEEREHVTPYIYTHPEIFRILQYTDVENHSHHRWTVDTEEDFRLISTILEAIYPTNPMFSYADVLELLKDHDDWLQWNAEIEQKNWER